MPPYQDCVTAASMCGSVKIFDEQARGSPYGKPARLCTTRRCEEATLDKTWLTAVGTLAGAEKMKIDTAMERIVSTVRRRFRSRFLSIKFRYFVTTLSGLTHPPADRAGGNGIGCTVG